MERSKNENLAKLKELCEKRDSLGEATDWDIADKKDYQRYSKISETIDNFFDKKCKDGFKILKTCSIAEMTEGLVVLQLKNAENLFLDIERFLENFAYCYDYKGEVNARYAYCSEELINFLKCRNKHIEEQDNGK